MVKCTEALGTGHQIPIIKITSAQRMSLVGIKPDSINQTWKELGLYVGPAVEVCVNYVNTCPGTAVCKFGVQDSFGFGGKLEELFVGQQMPGKVKIGIYGYPINGGEGYAKDFGAFGKKSGWTILFGGKARAKPRVADVVAEGLSTEQAIECAKKCFDYYESNTKPKERSARFIERIGIEEFKKAVQP